MRKRYIMTAFGEDRPGLIADVTEPLYKFGYNLEDSRMTRLLNEFVIIMSFSGPEENIKDIENSCKQLEKDKGIIACIRPVSLREIKKKDKANIKKLHIEGYDQTGIVYRITRKLSERNINIENLESEIIKSPESGSDIYRMNIYIQVPDRFDLSLLNKDIETLSNELNIEISII